MHIYHSLYFLVLNIKCRRGNSASFLKKTTQAAVTNQEGGREKTKSQTIFYWFHCACHSLKMTAVFLTGIQSSHSTFYPGGLKLRCTQSDRMKTSFRPLEVLRRDVVAFGFGAAFTLKRNKSQSLDAAFPASIISWPLRMEMHLLVNN